MQTQIWKELTVKEIVTVNRDLKEYLFKLKSNQKVAILVNLFKVSMRMFPKVLVACLTSEEEIKNIMLLTATYLKIKKLQKHGTKNNKTANLVKNENFNYLSFSMRALSSWNYKKNSDITQWQKTNLVEQKPQVAST